MFFTLFLASFQGIMDAWNSASDLWSQFQAAVQVVWDTLFSPLVLVTLGFIALEGK